MFKGLGAAVAVAGALWAGQANAAITLRFDALSSGLGITGYFETVLPYIDGTVFLPASQMTTCAVFVNGNSRACETAGLANGIANDYVSFGVTGVGFPQWYFDNVAFDQVGTYETVVFGASQAARLTISGTFDPRPPPPPAPIPEPGTWATLLAGFFGVGAAIRGRRRRLSAA